MKSEEKKLAETVGLESAKDSLKADPPGANLRAITNVSKNLVQNWNIPPFVVLFIANSLRESKEGRVLPWNYFKKLLYDVYEEKIRNAAEIYGSINSNYVPLEEYVLLYFLNKCKLRRLAEIKVIELLTSLKYYLAIWPRAKTFAQLAGFLRFGDMYTMETDTNNASTDIYLQDYYLTCFSLCHKERSALIESAEGNTYFLAEKEPALSGATLSWMTETERKEWTGLVKKHVKKGIEGTDKELIDVDVLLSLYLDQYLTKKKKQQGTILKQFNRAFNQNEGIFTTEEVGSVVQAAKLGKPPSPFSQYPGTVSRLRAFMYALTCDANSYEIKAKHFLAGCTRFGLDAPFPFIYARIYLFGTSTEVEKEVYTQAMQGGTGAIPGLLNEHCSVGRRKGRTDTESGNAAGTTKTGTGEIAPSLTASSAMFAQHFSILRELKAKCATYKLTIEQEEERKEAERVWDAFHEVQKVLELACQFLDFPIET